MPKRTNPTCMDCGLNWSHEAASERRCFVGRACISKRSRYRNRADDLEQTGVEALIDLYVQKGDRASPI